MKDHGKPSDSKDTAKETTETKEPVGDRATLSIQGKEYNDKGTLDAPPEHIPAAASGELGDARRAETDAEKTEVKHHHPTEEEVKEKKEGSIRPPEGWRPGGIEGR